MTKNEEKILKNNFVEKEEKIEKTQKNGEKTQKNAKKSGKNAKKSEKIANFEGKDTSSTLLNNENKGKDGKEGKREENLAKNQQKNIKNAEKTKKNAKKSVKKSKKIEKNAKIAEKEAENDEKNLSLKKKIIRTAIVVLALCAIAVLGYYVLVWTGAWEYINSVEKIRELILSLGFWGRLAFVCIQFLQVTFLPIPSTISTLAGVLIYGPLEAALLSIAGILFGSALAFLLGRVFGRRLVTFMVGKASCEKWTKFLTDAKYSFFIMMLLPMFPDDVLCLVAGLTNMSWSFFVITNLISRPIGVFLTCYLGSGSIVPYHGWGLIVWAVIVVLVIAAIYLSYKYREQIENFMKKVFRAKEKK